jgi:hypothetical protein
VRGGGKDARCVNKLKAECAPEEWAAYLERKRESSRKRHAANPEKVRERNHKWRTAHREKVRASNRKWYAANRKKCLERIRERKRNMPAPMFESLLFLQDNACAVCRTPFTKTPYADHCHDSKRPRGLLCSHCNHAEGLIKKMNLAPDFGRRLAAYLADPPARTTELV